MLGDRTRDGLLDGRPVGRPAAVRGAHIVFTGIDGAGKSTQGGQLCKRLADVGYATYLCESKEDFAVQTMRAIAMRQGLTSPRAVFGNEGTDLAKAFDTLRDQVQLVAPLRAAGCIVIQPRSGYCRVALASSMGSRNVEQVEAVTHFAGEPDLTIWLDVPAEEAYERIEARGVDTEDLGMLQRFGEALADLAPRYDWCRIDGTRPVADVREAVWEAVSGWLHRSGRRPIRVPVEVDA